MLLTIPGFTTLGGTLIPTCWAPALQWHVCPLTLAIVLDRIWTCTPTPRRPDQRPDRRVEGGAPGFVQKLDHAAVGLLQHRSWRRFALATPGAGSCRDYSSTRCRNPLLVGVGLRHPWHPASAISRRRHRVRATPALVKAGHFAAVVSFGHRPQKLSGLLFSPSGPNDSNASPVSRRVRR